MEPAPATPPVVRRSRLDPVERRAQIVAVAAEVLRGRDPATVRFDEVAQAAGVSRSLVYAYFGDRGELIAAVLLHTVSDLDTELSQLLRDVPVSEARLRAVVRHFFELAEENADSWRLFAAAGSLEHPAVQESRRARCQRIADTWGGGPAERLLARGIVGMLEAAASEWLEHRACSLDDAAGLLSQAMWLGVSRLPRPARDESLEGASS
jgi:AcrR family transcriptional regulator